MLLKIGTWTQEVASFEEASAVYQQLRGIGSRMGVLRHKAIIYGEIASISHNGRVWRAGEWLPGDRPLYDPRGEK